MDPVVRHLVGAAGAARTLARRETTALTPRGGVMDTALVGRGKEATDVELLAAWRDGSDRAAETLMRRQYAGIHRFFDLRAPAQADDLTQRTFLGAMEGLERFRGEASFRTFLFAIAHKQLLRYLRERGREKRLERFGQESKHVTSLSIVAARRQEQRLLLMAWTELPLELQLATELYYWEGMRTAEIGEVLGLNSSTVSTRLARARELLLANIEAMTRPGPLRKHVADNLEKLCGELGPVTAAANARRA